MKGFYKLHNTRDMNDFADWDIYWLASITSIRAIWHVLSEQDLKNSVIKKKLLAEYKQKRAGYDIFQGFVRNQRDRTIKKWTWDIIAQDFMVGGKRGDPFLATHKSLVFKYPNPTQQNVDVDKDLQGEDPIRLLGLALEFLYEDLWLMEIALDHHCSESFDSDRFKKIYYESGLVEKAPKYYR